MTYSLIKFPAVYIDTKGDRQVIKAEFSLGQGPCGKTVKSLDYRIDENRDLTVTQVCTDGSSQVFHYRDRDILGRIEVHTKAFPTTEPREFFR